MKLYELTENYNRVLDLANDPDIDPQVLTDTLEAIEGAIEHKAENIAKLIKCIDADVNALKEEEQRLASKRKALENRKSSIKQYLEMQLSKAGLKKIKGKIFTVALQDSPPSVFVEDESMIPEQYWIPQNPVLDKKSILQALKNNANIPGVSLQQTKSLRIR